MNITKGYKTIAKINVFYKPIKPPMLRLKPVQYETIDV